LRALGFEGVVPEAAGRPAYHPATMLKIYVYGYVNQIASSRRLEREAQRNVEMMWLTGRLAPDFKTNRHSGIVTGVLALRRRSGRRNARNAHACLSRSPPSSASRSRALYRAAHRSIARRRWSRWR
jgi:hypothetical protein